MPQIVQCSPNFSEGARPAVLEAIVEAIRSCGAQILDTQSDGEQNRSVILFAGDVPTVERAAFAAADKAIELIDMRRHRGRHPRIGAVDVIPIVPVSGTSVADCTAMAHRLGERLGRELDLPVYLYAEAAARPDRADLTAIRAVEYEGLARSIADDPMRAPDYGPSTIGAAGATAIGVRHPWVAYRVGLGTSSARVAETIAAELGAASGGPCDVETYVAASDADGRCVLELHVMRPDVTPLSRVLELVRMEAGRRGTTVGRCEIAGFVTLEALLRSTAWSLQLDELPARQVVEQRFWSVEPSGEADDVAPVEFLSAVASETPAPGGGAVAALVGALAAALDVMVAGLTVGQERFAGAHAEMRQLRSEAAQHQRRLLDAVRGEREAYDAAQAAHELPHATAEEAAARREALDAAGRAAIELPLGIVRDAVAVLRLCRIAAEMGAPAALGDSGVGAIMAHAAARAAAVNVELGIRGLRDLEEGDRYRRTCQSLLREAEPLAAEVDRLVRSRMVT